MKLPLVSLAALVALLGLLNSGAQVAYADGDGCDVSEGVTHVGETITGTRNADIIDCSGSSTGHMINGQSSGNGR